MNARTIRPRAKSIDEAPVGYYCSNGAALAPRRHCELCLHQSTEQNRTLREGATYLLRARRIQSRRKPAASDVMRRKPCGSTRCWAAERRLRRLPAGVSKVSQGRSKEQQTAPWRYKAFQQR